MTWLAFITEMTKATAWPVAVVIILAIWRKTLPNLIERLRSLKYGAFEAAFTEQSVQVAENISGASQPLSTSASTITDDKLLRLAQQSPRAAVIEAWLQIERRLQELAAQAGADTKSRSDIAGLLQSLRAANAIGADTERGLLGLAHMRNLAAQKAVDFVTLAGALLWTLSAPPKS